MTLRIPLSQHHYMTLISLCSMYDSNDAKELFYDQLSTTISSVSSKDRLLRIGDFNARVGRNHESWRKELGKHGVGKENSNGTLLLTLCSMHQLTITNTLFQQQDKYKTTWMSKHWHMIDFVITRQAHI